MYLSALGINASPVYSSEPPPTAGVINFLPFTLFIFACPGSYPSVDEEYRPFKSYCAIGVKLPARP